MQCFPMRKAITIPIQPGTTTRLLIVLMKLYGLHYPLKFYRNFYAHPIFSNRHRDPFSGYWTRTSRFKIDRSIQLLLSTVLSFYTLLSDHIIVNGYWKTLPEDHSAGGLGAWFPQLEIGDKTRAFLRTNCVSRFIGTFARQGSWRWRNSMGISLLFQPQGTLLSSYIEKQAQPLSELYIYIAEK